MRIFLFKKWTIILSISLIIVLSIFIYFFTTIYNNKTNNFFLGGTLLNIKEYDNYYYEDVDGNKNEYQEFFRPSSAPILNTKNVSNILNENAGIKSYTDVKLNNDIFKNSEEMILYYYSILREAYNLEEGLGAGCGSLGVSYIAHMISYNFLSKDYMSKLSYEDYYNSFKNILHINLIKLFKVQNDENDTTNQKYFIELETIQGTKNNSGAFVYYYGFIYVTNQDGLYKINNIVLYPEIYLCAPYHGWSYYAESVVDIEYGDWCSMVKQRYNTKYDGDIKNIEFKSFDDKNYVIKFVTLTNDTDVQIGQYIKDKNGKLNEIYINVESCLEKKNNPS